MRTRPTDEHLCATDKPDFIGQLSDALGADRSEVVRALGHALLDYQARAASSGRNLPSTGAHRRL